jgi:hypothetical protein
MSKLSAALIAGLFAVSVNVFAADAAPNAAAPVAEKAAAPAAEKPAAPAKKTKHKHVKKAKAAAPAEAAVAK